MTHFRLDPFTVINFKGEHWVWRLESDNNILDIIFKPEIFSNDTQTGVCVSICAKVSSFTLEILEYFRHVDYSLRRNIFVAFNILHSL